MCKRTVIGQAEGMKVSWPARFSYGQTASPPSLPFHRSLSSGSALMLAPHFGGLGVDSWSWFSYKIRWRLWSRTAAEAAPGARRFVAQNGFCSTKTHLARPLGRVSEKKVRLPKVFQFGGKAMQTLQSACNKGCLNFFPRFPGISFTMNILTNDLLFCR